MLIQLTKISISHEITIINLNIKVIGEISKLENENTGSVNCRLNNSKHSAVKH